MQPSVVEPLRDRSHRHFPTVAGETDVAKDLVSGVVEFAAQLETAAEQESAADPV